MFCSCHSLLLLTALIISQIWAQVPEYTVVVVEYHPVPSENVPPGLLISRNVAQYQQIMMKVAETTKYDLIAFPESTLTSSGIKTSHSDLLEYSVQVPSPEEEISPCFTSEGWPSYFILLSCLSFAYNTFLSVNLIERAQCSNGTDEGGDDGEKHCADDNWDYYNTNVIFNRNGTIVGRYRKYNLFGEYLLNQTATPDISIVRTDFGVNFGVFTCFDILFPQPAIELIRKHGIKHFVFPSMWFSELPFLTALQAQQQWAQEFDVVLLAAGANEPRVGSGGTGVYQGKTGPVVYDILDTANSSYYITKLPQSTAFNTPETNIDDLARKMDGFHLKHDDLRFYTSRLLDPRESEVQETLCSGEGENQLCCNFQVSTLLKEMPFDEGRRYQYHMVAYSGVRTFSGVATGGVEICGIVACAGETMDTCGLRFRDYNEVFWPATFTRISIKANFSKVENKVQFPNSLLSSIRPLPVEATEWTSTNYGDAIIERRFDLKVPQNRLMTFAIFGRDFKRDGEPLPDIPQDDNGTRSLTPSFLIFITIIFLLSVEF